MVKVNLDKKIFEELSFCNNKFVYQGYELPTGYHEGTDSYYFLIEFIWGNYNESSRKFLRELREKIIIHVRNKYAIENPPYVYKDRIFTPSIYSGTGHTSEYLKICHCGKFYYCQSKRAKSCNDCTIKPKISSYTKKIYNQTYYQKNRNRQEEKQCLVCGQLFIPKKVTKKTCSDKCRKILQRSKQDKT